MTSEGVAIGFTRKGELVRIPIASMRAVMSLLLGATGSGKTILQVLLALAAIKRGMGVGFAGIGNDLYYLDKTLMLFGDARKVVADLVKELAAASAPA